MTDSLADCSAQHQLDVVTAALVALDRREQELLVGWLSESCSSSFVRLLAGKAGISDVLTDEAELVRRFYDAKRRWDFEAELSISHEMARRGLHKVMDAALRKFRRVANLADWMPRGNGH